MDRNLHDESLRALLQRVDSFVTQVRLHRYRIECEHLRVQNDDLRRDNQVKDDQITMMKERDLCHECGCRLWDA
jgi:hypothetical protein